MTSPADYDLLLRTIRAARELEKGSFYNAAKLFWAAAFSHEIRATTAMPLDGGPDALREELDAVIGALEGAGADPVLIAAMRAGMRGVRENHTITHDEVPAAAVWPWWLTVIVC